MKKSIIKYINSRFNNYYANIDSKTDMEFANTLKGYLTEYFNIQTIDVRVQQRSESIETLRYLRETLLVEIDTTEYYVSNPTIVTVEKQLQGYQLVFRIRGIDASKMLRLAERAHRLIEEQDDINYPEEG